MRISATVGGRDVGATVRAIAERAATVIVVHLPDDAVPWTSDM